MLHWTAEGPDELVVPALGIILDLELKEGQTPDVDLKVEGGNLFPGPHGVEAVVAHVLRLALVPAVRVLGVSDDAHLHVGVDDLVAALGTGNVLEWMEENQINL